MDITVIGTGYLGLVAGACLADMGNDVICIDNNLDKIAQLKKGIIPIYEPGLEELIKSNVAEKRLSFSSDLDNAVKISEVCFIAVGTPQGEDGSADLQYVFEVAKSIAKAMNGYKVIVDKSTVPVGTAEKVGADAEMVRVGMSTDSRIGNKFLFPGLGYGGSCFPKDVKALTKTGQDYNFDMNIINTADVINKNQRQIFIKKILNKFGNDLTGKIFALWESAFKPKTNDMRETPSITIINALLNAGAKIQAYDPKAFEVNNRECTCVIS